MTKDLEATLEELGGGYRELVDRMLAAYPGEGAGCRLPPRAAAHRFRAAAYLAAALFAAVVAFAAVFLCASGTEERVFTVTYRPTPSQIVEIVSSQRDDGSWATDRETRQNAAALRGASDPAAAESYRKAVEYLDSRGLRPLTDDEFRAVAEFAGEASERS